MRDQGRLVEWFDDQGYGFIQPNDLSKPRVFLHISDFTHRGPRPILGCALDYAVMADERGRFRAKQVVYLKANQTRKAAESKKQPSGQPLHPIVIIVVIYALFLVLAAGLNAVPSWLPLYVLLVNAICYWQYMQDKAAAQQNQRRVPEKTLHLLSLLGGWPAAWFAQQKLRHKTQKQPFRQIYFATIVLNIILLCIFIALLPKIMH
ncbi:DUF1294 domain-containing protein [Acinetobacter sp. MB5]|uniref:DUF1294 domain-containing protein n=1 Tax=Acinetobacter sp. MB5 TaxID=2069438 RepID=UPI000DCFD1A0|nr:DUF1294 domain-containing protein [Acinetobacter sp. MB5]